MSEGGAGWIPYILERCDKVFYDRRLDMRDQRWIYARPRRLIRGCIWPFSYHLLGLSLWRLDLPILCPLNTELAALLNHMSQLMR